MKQSYISRLFCGGYIEGKKWAFYANESVWCFMVADDEDSPPTYNERVPLTEPLSVSELNTVIAHAKSRYYASIGKGNYA